MSARIVLIAGPTASGKSALASVLAGADGVVINADALQVYAAWRILTARPSDEETARIPHRLYGHVDLRAAYSVGRWLREVAAELETCRQTDRRAIIVGGTGLYFRALTQGLAETPEVDPAVRTALSARQAEIGAPAFFAELRARDPATAASLDPQNPRRVLRAREVLEQTGEGLAAWAARTGPPLVPPDAAERWVIDPPRAVLRARIAARLDAMLADGALDEVRAVMNQGFGPEDFEATPGLKAIGAAQLRAHIAGEITLEAAREAAIDATRRYAKRQSTWFRNQTSDWPRRAR